MYISAWYMGFVFLFQSERDLELLVWFCFPSFTCMEEKGCDEENVACVCSNSTGCDWLW